MEEHKKTTVSKTKPNSTTRAKKTSTVKAKKPKKSNTKKKQTWKQKLEKFLKKNKKTSHKKKGRPKKKKQAMQIMISKELIVAILTITFSIIVVIGTTYAAFTTLVTGNKAHSVIAGNLNIEFTEGENITLNNAYPISDEKGMEVAPYTFTIKNTGTIDVMYRIKLEEDTTDPKSMVPKDKIKISYKKGTNNYTTPQLLSNFENSLILVSDETLTTGSSITYEIKMWIDEQAGNEIQGKTYKTKVVVEAVQKINGEYEDSVPPVITLNGEVNQYLSKGSSYTESGVSSVVDDTDGTIATSKVTKSYEYYNGSTTTTVSSVNTNNIGIYYITYKVKDSNENEGIVVRTIIVNQPDVTAPILTLSGSTSISMFDYQTYQEPGYSATDDNDGSLTSRVIVLGTPAHGAGSYIIKYIVMDDAGNFDSKTRTVVVKSGYVSDVLKDQVGSSGTITTTDSEQEFITGTNPNNYIWYSGKLWRAISIDLSDNSVKMVTQWPVTAIAYNSSGNTAFSGSYIDKWLNDAGNDGFLGTLKDYSNFIKTDSVWNATMTTETTKPAKTTMVTRAIGLMNIYEYTMSYTGTTASKGYINNGSYFYLLNPYSSTNVWRALSSASNVAPNSLSYGVRPAVNVLPSLKISSGSGTETDPYRFEEEEIPSAGTLLTSRYSGEYVNFNDEKYRIVDSSNGYTKIIKVDPLTTSRVFDSNSTTTTAFSTSSTTNIGYYLNTTWYDTLTTTSKNLMTTGPWYLGTVSSGGNYILSKCTTTSCTSKATSVTARVGLPRLGELMSGQFAKTGNKTIWLLTPNSTTQVYYLYSAAFISGASPSSNTYYVRPSLYLKSTVKISGGQGTFESPFDLTT